METEGRANRGGFVFSLSLLSKDAKRLVFPSRVKLLCFCGPCFFASSPLRWVSGGCCRGGLGEDETLCEASSHVRSLCLLACFLVCRYLEMVRH